MSDASKAVFLSYASQDAEAARKICDALRAAGVEVWFDQSELVGGDAWDQKIRKQIKECALLIPIISQNTQARHEGYFRLEWRLADQRTHLMGRSRAFLLPVTIDGTTDADADVPDSFVAVQWTKAPAGEAPAAFCARVKKLLSNEQGAPSHEPRTENREPFNSAQGRPKTAKPTKPRWLAPVFGGIVVAAIALAIARPWSKPPAANAPGAVETPAQAEAHKLVAQARALIDDDPLAVRENFRAAYELGERATTLSPDDSEAWAILARANFEMIVSYNERSDKRREAHRSQAERAIRLAPNSVEAGLAMAGWELSTADNTAAAKTRLLRLNQQAPEDRRVLRMLVRLSEDNREDLDESRQWAERANALPGGDALALAGLAWSYWGQTRYPELRDALERSLAIQPTAQAYHLKLLLLVATGDIDDARRWLLQIPPSILREDRVAAMAYIAQIYARDFVGALQTVAAIPRDFLEEGRYYSPRGYLAGSALLYAGKPQAAAVEFRAALKAIDERLAQNPHDNRLVYFRAQTLARLGDRDEAERQLSLAREFGRYDLPDLEVSALLGRTDEVIATVDRIVDRTKSRWPNFFVNVKYNPVLDSFRSDPRLQEIIARGDRWMAELMHPGKAGAAGTTPGAVDAKSVAVLAFANLSDDKSNEYFSDGISEELLNVLAKVPGLKVSARTSAFYFKGKDVPIPEIAQKLGVAYVVEGSVRKSGDKVRITAQLIKAADGFHVWSDTFTRDLKDIFAVQDEIAGLIAKNLEVKMGVTTARPTIDLEAYQEYLSGRAAAAKADMAGLQEAVTHFERAVAIEPKFTAGWVQLASAHTQLGRWGGTPTLQAWQAARDAIGHATELEPDSPDVLLALGWIKRTADWDWRAAEQAYRRALQLRPNHSDTLAAAAVLFFNLGCNEEAFRMGRQAVQLDPLNAATQIDLSLMYYFSDNWAESEKLARRALQLAPTGASYHSILAWSLIKQGRLAEAEAEVVRDTDRVEVPLTQGLLANIRGRPEVAHAKLAELEEIARRDGNLADLQNGIAWLSVALGEKDRAFVALEKARDSRDPSMAWLRNTPYLSPLYSDSRWDRLLHQVGLADDQLK